jgi:RNA polymerase sigma factor (sigma-70 family)
LLLMLPVHLALVDDQSTRCQVSTTITASPDHAILEVRPGDQEAATEVDGWLAEYAASRDPGLRERIILAYLGLADRLASRFRHSRGTNREDLVQTARAGLIAAIDRYDPDRGTPFVPYAVACVVGEVKRYLRDTSWRLQVPRRRKEQALRLARAADELYQRLGRSPTTAELAEQLELGEEEVLEALAAVGSRWELSLDQPAGGDADLRLADLVPAPEAGGGARGPAGPARPGGQAARAGTRGHRAAVLSGAGPVRDRGPGRLLPDARLAPAAPGPGPDAHPANRSLSDSRR